jgi:hypothetical protein
VFQRIREWQGERNVQSLRGIDFKLRQFTLTSMENDSHGHTFRRVSSRFCHNVGRSTFSIRPKCKVYGRATTSTLGCDAKFSDLRLVFGNVRT